MFRTNVINTAAKKIINFRKTKFFIKNQICFALFLSDTTFA